MRMLTDISWKKFIPVFSNALYLLLPGLINQLLAYFVIALSGSNSWGAIVQLQLYYYLATAVIAWGNKDFLLVQFSRQPHAVTTLWQQSFLTRFTLLALPVLVLTCVIYPAGISIHLCCWIMLRHFTQSAESIATYKRSYKVVLISELIAGLPVFLLLFFAHRLNTSHVLLMLTLIHACRAIVLSGSYQPFFRHLFRNTLKPRQLRLSLPFMLLSFAGFLQARSDLYCLSFLSDKTTIGNYQVLISYVSLCLLIPGFLYTPYVNQFYTMNAAAVRSLQQKLNRAGIAFAITAIMVVALAMIFLYGLEFSFADYILATIYVTAPYLFMPHIYAMFRHGVQKWVMLISFSGVAINAFFCFSLVPYFGITGALGANCVSQLFLFMVYRRVKIAAKEQISK